MTLYFVSRHQGAKDWAQVQGIDAFFLDHLDVETIQPGDVVMGTLPVSLAAEVCARGARYFHLTFSAPVGRRGEELTAMALNDLGARLVEYLVRELEDFDD